MKLVKALELRNVCRIERERIEFGMLTRVEGENDAGKSTSVYAALEIALLCDPFPESMVRRGEREASIRVEFTDGSSVERRRSGAKQECTLVYADGTRKDFLTVKDIVDEVRAFTGCQEIRLDKNASPESFQFIPLDAPQTYLLHGVDPRGVLKRITKVAGGAGIETAKATIESEIRKQNAAKDQLAAVVEAGHTRIKDVWEIAGVAKLTEQVNEIQDLEQEIEERVRVLDTLTNFHKEWKEVTDIQKEVDRVKFDEVGAEIDELEALQRQHAVAVREADDLQQFLNDLVDPAALAKASKLLASVDLDKMSALLKQSTDLSKEVDDLVDHFMTEGAAIDAIDAGNAELKKLEAEIAKAENARKTCPECGQPIEEVA